MYNVKAAASAFAVLGWLLAVPAVAQQGTAELRGRVMDLPTGRHPQAFAALIPGVALYGGVGGAQQDIGGSFAIVQTPVTYRGGNMVQGVEGMRQNNMSSVGEFSEIYWNDGMFQEITFITGADSAEIANNGIRINMIPRDGGNTFRGTLYANYTGPSWNANNIQEQSSGQWYNAYNTGESLQTHEQDTYKAKMSFVTGSHDFRVGMDLSTGERRLVNRRTGFLTMRQNNGVFNRITMYLPLDRTERLNADGGAFVNDKWTLKRATITAGVRYEWYRSEAKPSSVLPNPWSPSATFDGVEKVPDWKDLQPRLGLSYDLFGNGKTALKVSVSRYSDPATLWWVGGAAGFAGYPGAAPVLRLVNQEDRLWTDINGDSTVFNPDGTVQDSEFNPRYPEATSEIGAAPSGSIFGQLRPQTTIIDPGPNEGWFKRQYNWEFSGTLQHQVMNGVAASLTYWKRTRAGNEPSVDNINIGPADFDGPFCVTAPSDPRLPSGGGFDVCGLYDLNPAARLRPVQNKLTHIKDHGEGVDIKDYYHGVEMTMNARLGGGTFLQGGLSMQRIVFSACEYTPKIDSPEALRVNAVTGRPQCDTTQPFRPNAKFSGAYQLPWYGVQLSGTYVAPDIGAMAECGVEHASLAECPFPGLRVVAAPRHFRQVAEVAPFGVDAQEDVDAVPRE